MIMCDMQAVLTSRLWAWLSLLVHFERQPSDAILLLVIPENTVQSFHKHFIPKYPLDFSKGSV